MTWQAVGDHVQHCLHCHSGLLSRQVLEMWREHGSRMVLRVVFVISDVSSSVVQLKIWAQLNSLVTVALAKNAMIAIKRPLRTTPTNSRLPIALLHRTFTSYKV